MLTTIEKVIFLQNVEIFSLVSSENLAFLAAITEEVSLLTGETIFREGDPADAVYLVLDGRVKLDRGREEITEFGHGEAFGTWALLDEEPRVATASCVEDAKLLRIWREDFYELLTDHVRITEGVFKSLIGRIRSLLPRVAQNGKES